MNNKEKREYISCLHLMENIELCHPEEIVRIRKVLTKCPDSLYKYRKFDKWTRDIFEKNYAYLSPVKDLDDPFDCRSDFDTRNITGKDNKEITSYFIEKLIKKHKIPIKDHEIGIVKKYKGAFKTDDFDEDQIYKALNNEGVIGEEADQAVAICENFFNISEVYKDNKTFESFLNILYKPDESVGVCALSEINDNKVMWSLYGKKYEGYCIEYHIRETKQARRFLFPVIYSREANNNFTEKVFDTMFSEVIRQMFNNPFLVEKEIGPVGAIYELFCTKDIDWRYQKEWRIVGDPKGHFVDVDIKAVYLGFKVTKTNEQRMISYAKQFKFNLYKMKAPDGKKKIRYIKLV